MDQRILEIEGWMADVELEWLHQTAQKLPEGALAVSLGAWLGRSDAALFTGALPSVSVVSIDTWRGTEGEPGHEIAKTQNIQAQYMENMANLDIVVKPYNRARIGPQYLQQDSVWAAQLFEPKSVDFLFVDDDHRNPGGALDVWLPCMKDGSLVCGHDYFCFYEYIQPQVHARLHHIHEIRNSIWVKYWNTDPVDSRPMWYED